MKVKWIFIKKEKSSKREKIEEAYFKKDLGLFGDIKSQGGDIQVSILSFKDRDCIEKNPSKAICMNRFHENITIEGLESVDLDLGHTLKIGETIVEITSVGKACFEECSLFKSGEKCLLSRGTIFAKVIESGKVKVGDNVDIIKTRDNLMKN